MNIRIYVVLIVLFPLMNSCVSLNEVNRYAAASAASLNKLNDVNYTFNDYCRQDCELQQMRSGEIDTLFTCDCREPAAKADEAIRKIHSTIASYLVAIEELSNNKGFTYDVSNLTGSLQQSPLLKLTDAQVTVYTKAGNFIAAAATTFYRKKKLKEYIEKADPVFQELTETFIFLINGRLREQLRINYDARLANLTQMLDNAKNDKGFKQIIIKSFIDEQSFYQQHTALIDAYSALLGTVKKGHHDLYLQRNNLKDLKTRELIKQCAEDIQNIVTTVANNNQ